MNKTIAEAILKEILENAKIGYWDRNLVTGEEVMSPALKQMLGYEDSEIPNTIEAADNLIVNADLPIITDSFMAHAKNGGTVPFSCEIRTRHKNGNIVWVLCRGKVIEWDGMNNPVRLIGCNIDITEQKRTEETLRNVVANFQAVLGSTNDIIASYDTELRLIVFNKACSDIYRRLFNVEIYPGMITTELFSDEMKTFSEQFDRRALSGECFSIDYDIPFPDGEVRSYEAIYNPIYKNKSITGFTTFVRDITDRKKIEKALSESEENYRTLIDNMQDAVYRCDLDGNLTYFSPSSVQLLGYSNSAEFPGKNIADAFYYDPGERDKLIAILQEKGMVSNFEVILKRSDNTPVIVQTNSHFYKDKNGKIIGIEGVFHDVTAYRQAEEALKKNEKEYRSLVNNMQDVVYRCDLDGNITFTTPSAVSLLGYDNVEQLIGMNISRDFYFNIGERDRLVSTMKEDGKISNYELTLKKRDGTPVYIVTNSQFFYDDNGKIIGIEGVYHNITERKLAEKALMESEENYKSLINNMQDAVYRTDLDGNVTFFSPAAAKQLGFSSEDNLTGINIMRDFFIHSEDQAEVLKHLKEDGKISDFELDIKRKDGSIITIVTNSQYSYDTDGNKIGIDSVFHDITERKKAEEALRKNDALLRSIFEASPAGISLVLDRVFQKVNTTLCNITGYSEQELIGSKTRLIFFSDEEYEQTGKVYNVLESNGFATVETRLRHKNGNEIFALLSLSPINPADFNAGVVTTVLDLTDTRQAERTIKKNEILLRGLFEASPAGIALLVDRVIIKLNNALCKITGYNENDLLGEKTRILYFDDGEYNRVGRVYNKLIKTSPAIIESCFKRKDGEKVNVLISLSPINPLDLKSGVIATVLDITNMKRAEQTLMDNEKLMRSIFDASPAGISLVKNRIFLKVNSALCRITGYSENEVLGKDARMFYFTDEEYNRVGQLYSQIEKNEPLIIESNFRKKDGNEMNVLICFSALDANNFQTGVVSTVLDITELKKMEKEKKHLEEMLLHSQKLESIGRLAGGIAHDFNNMLTAILGNAELIKEHLSVSGDLYSKAEMIEGAALSAANLTRQLLAFSRKQVIEAKIMNLNSSIRNVQKMLLTLLGESIVLDIVENSSLQDINADPGQIEQVILNLVVNARDAMPKGGRIVIETRNELLDESYSRSHLNILPGPFVMLSISDTGCGMSKEVMKHCFEPFFTTKEKGKGTGMGLATVYGIVSQCGGTIEIYSEIGKGTVFKLYFPAVSKKTVQDVITDSQSSALLTGTETVLIAEDNDVVLQFSIDVLKRVGYNVLSANCGENALNIALNYNGKIDLLITDVILPGINGKETSEKMATIHPETKTLFNSGYTAEIIDKQGMLDEGIEFISKPYTAHQFTAKVREVLDKNRKLQ